MSGSPVRTDDAIRDDLLRLVECYTGEPGSWDARVDRGEVTVRRITGRPGTTGRSERLVVRALAHTVVGVISVRVPDLPRATAVIGIPA